MDQRNNSQTEREREYRPRIQYGERRVFEGEACVSTDQCEKMPEMDDSQLVGAPVTAAGTAKGELSVVAAVADVSAGKRRRGRPPRTQGKTAAAAPPPPSQKRKKDEEDVCFICFDGGSLVLCDRRGCPKAYHPACIKRDEAFFRSKAKWNCGWHICSSCQKASHFMCYTCTYSLCKGCTKDADYVCVRGNKGLCGTCMRTIRLIENITQGNEEVVQVDFDDNTSWEYLFKIYWIFLKTKLSLTLDELTKARNPWKSDELPKAKNSWNEVGTMASKANSSDEPHLVNNEKGSFLNHLCGNLEAAHSKRRKTNNYQPKVLNEESSLGTQKLGSDKVMHLPEGTTWATNELLEFVSHMRNGDVSMLSQFDVQALLLEYVKRHNLRDPRQKSQIVCDSRLIRLFGRERVGHFEMLKLLECHFLVKEKLSGDTVRSEVVDVIGSCTEAAENDNCQLTMGSDRRRKTRKKTDEGGSVANPNPDDYAAIDVHNISLLYLKRNLIENLMDDTEKFQEKVIGSFVRIRISCADPKQDMYRLVQVVGTINVTESYKVGTRTTNFMLEILNLDKKEVVSIDGISNQEFSEDECNRLRQSIKCGLIKPLKVGEIQKKAMVLQAVKIDDCLEAEILRFNHLRDRANEKGHRKELREYVEKVELLKSPEERKRRLLEVPSVHADPDMDPSCESEANAGEAHKKKQGNSGRPRTRGGSRKGSEAKALRGGDVMNDVGFREQMSLAVACGQGRNVSTPLYMDNGAARIHEKVNVSTLSQGGETLGLNGQNISKVGPTGSVVGFWNSHTLVQSESSSRIASADLPSALSTSSELPASDPETDRLWHYQDPTGKIQGPFSMMQLRKWDSSGLFPLDLRVWRINEKQEDSILLTDALIGRFHEHSQLTPNNYLVPHGVATINDTDTKWELGLGCNSGATWLDNKRVDHSWTSMQNDASVVYNSSDKLSKSNGWGSHSSSCTTAVNVAIANCGQVQFSAQGWDLSRGGNSVDQPQICNSFPPSSSSRKLSEMPLLPVQEGWGNEKCSSGSSHKTTQVPTSVNGSDVKRADSEGHSSQSSEENWRPPPREDALSRWNSNSIFVSIVKPVEKLKHTQEIDFSDLLSPTPKQIHTDIKGQSGENKQSVSPGLPAMESGPSWSTASSLVVGGAQLPEVVGEWGSYSSNPTKASAEEWDSNLVAASSLKPTEGASDHAATPTSGNGQPTHSSSTNPAADASSWQPIVPESNEFSLVDESVSDLLAEVEAMESLGGLPSPTSKMRCGGELTHDSDDDCFSPVEEFSPAPGKSDAFSSTSDIQMPSQLTIADEPLRLSDTPSQPTVTTAEPLGTSQRPLQLTVTDEPLQPQKIIADAPLCVVPSQLPVVDEPHQTSNVRSQSSVTDERLEIHQRPSDSTLPDESLQLSKSEVLDPQKSCGHSSTMAEAGGDARLSDVSVNQREASPKLQPPASSTVNQGETTSDIQPPTPSTLSQWEAGSDIQQTALTAIDNSLGSSKGNANLSQGGAAGGKNMVWGSGPSAARQQHPGTIAATLMENPSGWGNQPRYGGNRFSGPRDHRNYYPDRNSGSGKDRSSWNRQPSFGAGSGGGSLRPSPKGQRVCKFYESGYCKKGASCSYWHP